MNTTREVEYPEEVGPVKGFFIAMTFLALACVGGVIFLGLFAAAIRLVAQAVGFGFGVG